MTRSRLLTLLLCLSATACASYGAAGSGPRPEPALDRWMQDELQPYLAQTLTSHPRFKNETVLVVPMRDGRQDLGANELTRSLSDRLNDRLLQVDGVRLGWHGTGGSVGDDGAGECPGELRVHYLLGLELGPAGSGRHRLQMKALDLEDGNWVSGFGLEWQGVLSPGQREQLSRSWIDERMRGSRELPFTAQQTDLMARQLAEKLWCAMQRRGQEDLRVWVEGTSTAKDREMNDPVLTRLVANYLGRGRSLNLAADPDSAEAVLRVRRQHLYGELNQLWASLRAPPGASEVPALDSEVYFAESRDTSPAEETVQAHRFQQAAPAGNMADGLIRDVRLMVPRRASACRSPDPWHSGVRLLPVERSLHTGECYGLDMSLMPSTRMVLLRQVPGSGICRLGSATVPSSGRVRWPSGHAMDAGPGVSPVVYYLLAWTDVDAGRALGELLDGLQQDCGSSSSRAIEALEGWLSELDALMDRYPDRIHWQGVSVGTRT